MIAELRKEIELAADSRPLDVIEALLAKLRGGGGAVLKLDYVNSVLTYRKAKAEYEAMLKNSSQPFYTNKALNELVGARNRMEDMTNALIGQGIEIPEVEDYEPHGLFEVDHLHALHREAVKSSYKSYFNFDWVRPSAKENAFLTERWMNKLIADTKNWKLKITET